MIHKLTAACTLAAALLLGAPPASAAVDTERQLDVIAGADNAWNAVLGELAEADSYYMNFAPNDKPTLTIAVTDLDDNGRLEVIFCTSRQSGEGVAVARENNQSEAYIDALDTIAFVPLSVHALIYEVTEDGSALARVSYEQHNGELTTDFPDLTQLKEPLRISAEMGGARLYRIHTLVRETPAEPDARVQPFRVLYHTVWLREGTLYARLEAWEEANYAIYADGSVVGIPHTAYVDGREIAADTFEMAASYKDLTSVPAVRGSVHWISVPNFRDADFRSNVRTLLATSWYGFSYGLR